MGKLKLKFFVSILFITIIVFSTNIYAANIKASNSSELENIIIKQLKSLNSNFDINYSGSIDNINKLMNNILDKEPYLKSTITSIQWNTTSSSPNNHIVNVKAQHIVNKTQRNDTNKMIDNIISQIITPYMADHEKVKAINDYIVLNSEYDTSYKNNSDYELLSSGKSMCNGYATLTYNMLQRLNIPVKLVFGSSKGQSHVWNLVKLGEHWYHLDITWNDPLPNRENIVSYKYYMLTDEEIKKDHKIDENQNLPVSNYKYYNYLKYLSLSTINNHVYERLLKETGLDMYNVENTAATESELKKILNTKIKKHPTVITVRVNKTLDNDALNSAMSVLFDVKSVLEVSYDPVYSDNLNKNNILHIYIKYKDAPDSIITDLSNEAYNIETKVNFNVYAVYGNRKENITNSVCIYPYDTAFMQINGNSLTFKNVGMQDLFLEYEGIKSNVKITAISPQGFKYITDKKSNNPVNIKIFDKYIDFKEINQWPFIENSRTLVPLRAVFEVLNCEIDWDESNRSAIVQQKNIKIVIPVNSKTAYVNGAAITLDTPAKIVNGRIMVPLRFISESINKTVIWDSLNSTALIY